MAYSNPKGLPPSGTAKSPQKACAKKWMITGIITTLLLGFVLGVLADRALSLKQYKNWLASKDHSAKIITQEKILNRLSRKLNLTRAQIQAIGGILRIQSIKIKQLRKESKQRMKLIMKESREKIKKHLTPAQQQKYDKLIATHRNRWKKMCPKSLWKTKNI